MSSSTTIRRSHREVLAGIVMPVAAFLLVGMLVMGTSRAAFFDTAGNAGNSFGAGDVVLTDDDSGAAMFAVSNMAPGDTATKCIEVTYEGSLAPADIEMYVASGDLTGSGLDAYLDLTVELGTGGSFAGCTGFSGSSFYSGDLAGFAAAYTDFAGGTGSWTAAATDDAKTYRFTFTLQDDNDAQGLDAGITFTWEAQNQ
ncbi:MAG: TasA family protein [Actinomycetota bacterium]|nr:M73 family metallopeptidase [Actinomycetota bacterium]